jgi:hypothetical protein
VIGLALLWLVSVRCKKIDGAVVGIVYRIQCGGAIGRDKSLGVSSVVVSPLLPDSIFAVVWLPRISYSDIESRYPSSIGNNNHWCCLCPHRFCNFARGAWPQQLMMRFHQRALLRQDGQSR